MPPAVPVLLDLSTSDPEPTTAAGIQPHGFLLTLSAGLEVLQASANLADWTGCPAPDASGRPLAGVIGERAALQLAPELDSARLTARPLYLGTVTLENG